MLELLDESELDELDSLEDDEEPELEDEDSELKGILHRLITEAITNSAWHGHATKVRVRIMRESSQITVRVEDDGCGFDVSEIRGGPYGLYTMCTTLKRVLGAQYDVTSEPGKGTTFWMTIPTMLSEVSK